MLKDITLGKHCKADSILHKLDPRTKLFALLVYLTTLFLFNSPVYCLATVVVLVLLISLSKVPLKFMFCGLGPIVMIVLVTDLINIISNPESWIKTVLITVRVFEIVVSSNILTLTTKPKDIADGIEKSLGFLSAFKIPVHDFATTISIAVRFIPILTEEAERIMDAQKVRGADFENGTVFRRAKSILPVFIPLFVSAFRKADDLALAMDSRLYGTGTQSRLHPLKYCRCDFISFFISFAYLGIFICLRFICS